MKKKQKKQLITHKIKLTILVSEQFSTRKKITFQTIMKRPSVKPGFYFCMF